MSQYKHRETNEIINDSQYNELPLSEKNNYSKIEDDSETKSDFGNVGIMADGHLGIGLGGGLGLDLSDGHIGIKLF
jgi:hypothetical protein